MSRATAIVSVAQQLALSTGVAVGALVVEITLRLKHGTAMAATDFPPAFLVIGALTAAASLVFSPDGLRPMRREPKSTLELSLGAFHRSDFGNDHGTNQRCAKVQSRNNPRLSATRIARPAKACGILKNDVENIMKKPSPRSAATNSATTAPMIASVIEIFSALKM